MRTHIQKYYLAWLIIIGLAVFYFLVCFYQMRKGDDLLAPYYMSFLHYVDGADWKPVDRLWTVGQAIEQFAVYYLNFNGRTTTLFQGLLFSWGGHGIISAISALVYVSISLLTVRIGLKSWKKVFEAPAWILMCSVYMYQLTRTGLYIEMWTFVCQYAVPVLLYLLYYLLVTDTYQMVRISKRRIWGITVLALVAGSCHECLGIFCILLVTVKGVHESCFKKSMRFRRIWINTGLLAGYLITLLAPGNFKRLFSSHDSERFSMGIADKLKTSITEHAASTGIMETGSLMVLVIFILFIIITQLKKKKPIWEYIKDNFEFIIVLLASVAVWAVFAPPVPPYGLQLWKSVLIIFLLRLIDIDIIHTKQWNILGLSAMIVWIAFNALWMPDLIKVTLYRQEQISNAVAEGKNVVYIEKYPDSTDCYLTLKNYVNRNVFNNDQAIKYYGIEILIEGEQ